MKNFVASTIIVFAVMVSFMSYGQELPEVIPPSPTVANLMQFEEVPISYYTGQPNISIPMYSKAINGDLAVNIGLSYNTQGVKVNNVSGWTGTGWSLSAGGVVSRTVRGIPDEQPTNYDMHGTGVLHNDDFWDIPNLDPLTDYQEFLWEAAGSATDKYDYELDLFQFSFLGISGRFVVVKENGILVPKLLSKNQTIKIEIDYNNDPFHATDPLYKLYGFTITDNKGYIYIFDVREELASAPVIATTYFDNNQSTSGQGESYVSTRAWHLKRIEMPNSVNENLVLATFDYHTDGVSYNESVTRTYARVINPPNPTWNDFIAQSSAPYNATVIKPKLVQAFYAVSGGTKKVSNITFRDGTSIAFNLASLDNPETGGARLGSIEIKEGTTVNKTYSMTYDVTTDTSLSPIINYRLWLTKVTESAGSTSLDYTLEYNDKAELPGFDNINKTDDWGYYTKPSANSECGVIVPDSLAITKGLLSRIIYPTGGSKEFEFERHRITYQGNTQLTDEEYKDKNPDNWSPQEEPLSFNSATDNSGQGGTLFYSFTVSQEQTVVYKKDDVNTTATPSEEFNAFIKVTGPNNYEQVFRLEEDQAEFVVDTGTYEVRFYTLDVGTNFDFAGCIGYKNFKGSIKRYVYGGGVRIKNIVFKDDPLDVDDQKEVLFGYDDNITQNTSSGSIDGLLTGLVKTNTEWVTRWLLPENCPQNVQKHSFQFEVTSRALNTELTQGQYVGYKKVKTFESGNGYRQFNYTSAQDFYSPSAVFTYPYAPADDLDFKRGLLLKEEVFNENGDLLKEIINTYDYDENDIIAPSYRLYFQDCEWTPFYNDYTSMTNNSPNTPLNLCAGFVGCTDDCIGTYSNCGVPYYFISNNIKSTWAKLIKTETKDYFYDGGPADIKESRQEFVYDNTNFQIDSLKLYYNEKGIEQFYLTEYFYPHDPVMSTSASVRTKLDNINKVNEVLETITSKNGVQISQTNTEYHEFETNLILPKLVETKKGSGSAEERIEFYKYDSYGNPLEVGKTDGIKITYVWGFDSTVPLAKVINASYSDIEALTSFGSGFALTGNLSTQQVSDLRSLSNAMVSTYVYDPMVGMTSQQDARGYIMSYEYDDFNRLKFIKDQDNYILSKNEYHYAAQSSYVKSISYKVPTLDGLTGAIANHTLVDDDKMESITHFDGLGRAKQSIAKQVGGDKQHIVVPIFYDDYGRQMEEYLPMQSLVTGSTALDYINNDALKTSQQTHYDAKYSGEWANVSDVNAFSKKHFESSPLNRVLEQGAPGEDWKVDEASDADHTIKFDYQLNSANEVRLFDVTFINSNTEDPQLGYDGYYSANELFKTITKDENWQSGQTHGQDHTTEEFTNSQGQLVLKRTYDKGAAHDTYYVYDDFGNLTYVLSPEGSNAILDINDNIVQAELDRFGYQYRYDHRNRLVEKKIPQKGWEYIIYDELDRPVLTQDANMRGDKEWLFTKYDEFDRVAYTGLFIANETRLYVQGQVDAQTGTLNETRVATATALQYDPNTTLYYSNTVYPTAVEEVLTINYYDDYSWDTKNSYEASYDLDLSSGMGLTNSVVKKTLASTGWNAGFKTDNKIVDDGYIEWTIEEVDKGVTIGLTNTSASSSYHRDQIDYGIYTAGVGNNYRVYVFEQNVNITIPATYYVAGDVFRVLRSGDQIYYYKNDVIFYSSATTTTAELMGYGSFLHENAEAEDVFIGYSSLNQPFAQDLTGLATGSKVRTLDTDKWATNEIYYDTKGRAIQSTSNNTYLETSDRIASKLDFVGKVIKTHATHQTDKQTPVVTIDEFTYDHADRLSRQEQRVNNEDTELIARNHYDEFGQLEMKQVGGELKIDLNYANTVGVSIVSNIITKTASGSWGTAGLSTQNGILEDGYVSFTTVDINKAFMAGLSYTDPNVGYPSIKYAINITSGGDVGIYESGINKGFKTTHVPGDVFTVERRGETIYYYKNGEHFYTSETATTTATMYGDVAIASSNARIKDLSIYNLNGALQEVDYTYNVRGWLKDINNVDNLYATGNDLFALKLNYNKKDNTNSTSLYNGNISEIFWNTRTYDAGTSESQIKRGYTFEYDALNRLVDANFEKTSGANQTVLYDLSGVTYDKNGNIQTLERTGVDNLGVYQTDMDDLTYSYDGNQLTNVVEAGDKSFGFKEVSTQNDDYTYDVNGNMITDKNKDITSIEYNHLNLPTIVKFGTANTKKITYIYDATGLKLKKIVTDNSNTTSTEYRGNYIYENDGLKFFSHPEGYVEPVGKSFGYVYQYKDHLGNIRLSYSDTDGSNSINPNLEIVEENNYYPFGLKHKGYNNTVSANSNSQASKFKYNGMELEESLGVDWYEMDLRQYDPAIARWTAIDPVVHHSQSTYNAFDNNPVYWADPSGADSQSVDEWASQVQSDWNALDNGASIKDVWGSGKKNSKNKKEVDCPDCPDGVYENGTSWTASDGGVYIYDKLFGGWSSSPELSIIRRKNKKKESKMALAALAIERGTIINGTAASIDGPLPIMDVAAGISEALIWSYAAYLAIDAALQEDYSVTTTTTRESATVLLYRGVRWGHYDYSNAVKGMAVPLDFLNGHSDPFLHNEGNSKSIFTSWTLLEGTALKWAKRNGPGGIVLAKRFSIYEIIPSPNRFNEGEFLIPGIVTGASATRAGF